MKYGGKADALLSLEEAGFRVPSFFICLHTWSEEKVREEIKRRLHHARYFAVRSSGVNEDTKEKSFAGHYYSAIGVEEERVFSEIKKVRGSFGYTKGYVIVQEFVPSNKAGVLFTNTTSGVLIINATKGLCDTVVHGQACDEYSYDSEGKCLHKKIIAKKEIHVFQRGKIVSRNAVGESLTQKDISQLLTTAKSIETYFGSSQDIEWCFKGNQLFVLQSRPITSHISHHQEPMYFDSANIAESYSAIVLPLTFSFAQTVYAQVYRDMLHMSGVSLRKINEHKEIFTDLLGTYYGRMYYNMNNWYFMAAFAPGYKTNKENFELMITSNIKQPLTTDIKPSLLLIIVYPVIVLLKLLFFEVTSFQFSFIVKRELKRLRATDISGMSYPESIQLFHRINKELLRRWYVTVENDFLVMTYLGMLKKLLGEKHLQEVLTFPSKATEQVNTLAQLAKNMRAVPELWHAIQSNDVNGFTKVLLKNPEINLRLQQYLETFGGRFANELKLESVGIDEDQTKLFIVLRAYENFKVKTITVPDAVSFPHRKKIAVKIVIRFFKQYASRREVFRLLRSNAFGTARRIFRHMGEILVKKNILESIDDVFYLTLDELLNPQSVIDESLRALVVKRKKEYVGFEKVTPPSHFVTTDGKNPPLESLKPFHGKQMQARGASSGVVRGRVKVFKDFFLPEVIDFDIVVTSHTDPGWTSLIALSKGLIIEHGGVLSHASIVARELGIPAVIGATDALHSLRDGQLVEIDGSTGRITILS